MNDTELDAILETWEAPAPSPALREGVRHGIPHAPRKRSYGWAAAAASVAVTTSLIGVAMLGRGEARLADGTYIQSSMMVDPATSQERWRQLGSGVSVGRNRQQSYWQNQATHTYSGYDLTVQAMGGGQYLVTVAPLSTPLRKLSPDADAAQYREVPLPSIPVAKVVKDGEAFEIDLVRDAATGDRVFERVELSHNSFHSFFEDFATTVHHRHARFAMWLQSLFAGNQLHLDSPKLYINGSLVVAEEGASFAGDGVDFYLPGHGRYVMTLDLKGSRQFQLAGKVNGNTMEFQLEGNTYRIVSAQPIAARGEHAIYVFHEESYRVNPEIPELNRPSFFSSGR
ncbi:hypothetical protein SBA3_2490011 [Candidatus Sulfopaludibacter sp. SbA3]|nr:hypothetical protein SBA3_2490011 [Candidatus Sulfopaludibacter sp. SbA3]